MAIYQMRREDVPADLHFHDDPEHEIPADYEFEFNSEYDLPLYSRTRAYARLPQASVVGWGRELQERMTEVLPYLEIGMPEDWREFLIAPILLELARHLRVTPIRDYQHHALRSIPDYLLEGKDNHFVIEAKCGNADTGFRHLYLHLIGLDKWANAR